MGQIFTTSETSATDNKKAARKAAKRAEEQSKLEFADSCLSKAGAARELGDHISALGWQEQSLLVRTEVLGDSISLNYNQPYIANIIAIGETHLSLRRFDRALIYFLRAKSVLDPLMLQRTTAHTSAPIQYVNLAAGLALILTAVAKNNHRPTLQLLEGENPLKVAEQIVEQAVIRVVGVEGTRAPLLVSLYHILARIYLMTNKRMSALRVMQRCLGLTLHISQTKKVFSFLSYTRNVLDIIKELTLVERVVIRLQQWYRDRMAMKKLQRQLQEQEKKQKLLEQPFGAVPQIVNESVFGGGDNNISGGGGRPRAPKKVTLVLPPPLLVAAAQAGSAAESHAPAKKRDPAAAVGKGMSGLFQAAAASIISAIEANDWQASSSAAAAAATDRLQKQKATTSPATASATTATNTAATPTGASSRSPSTLETTRVPVGALSTAVTSPSSKHLLQYAESYSRHNDLLGATSSAHFLPSPALLHAIDQNFDNFQEDPALVRRRKRSATAAAETAARLLLKSAAHTKKMNAARAAAAASPLVAATTGEQQHQQQQQRSHFSFSDAAAKFKMQKESLRPAPGAASAADAHNDDDDERLNTNALLKTDEERLSFGGSASMMDGDDSKLVPNITAAFEASSYSESAGPTSSASLGVRSGGDAGAAGAGRSAALSSPSRDGSLPSQQQQHHFGHRHQQGTNVAMIRPGFGPGSQRPDSAEATRAQQQRAGGCEPTGIRSAPAAAFHLATTATGVGDISVLSNDINRRHKFDDDD